MRKTILLAAICAGSIAASTGVNAAQPVLDSGISAASDLSAAKKKPKSAKRYYRSSNAYRAYPERRSFGAIGCGYGGCGPVPPGCTVTAGFDWWGNYSGQDDVICGRR